MNSVVASELHDGPAAAASGQLSDNLKADRTFDYEFVRRVITHPKVFPWVTDDKSPAPGDYRPIEGEFVYYVKVGDEGVFVFVPENCATVSVHTCLTPALWGRSVEAAEAAKRWIFENTAFQRITTTVPQNNRLAQRLAERVGMTRFGRNPRSWLKGGVLMDQLLYGINKE